MTTTPRGDSPLEQIRELANYMDGLPEDNCVTAKITAGRLADILAASQGWVCVPVEPTDVMLTAARDWSHAKYGKPIGNDAAQGCYKTMIAAAQQQENSDGK